MSLNAAIPQLSPSSLEQPHQTYQTPSSSCNSFATTLRLIQADFNINEHRIPTTTTTTTTTTTDDDVAGKDEGCITGEVVRLQQLLLQREAELEKQRQALFAADTIAQQHHDALCDLRREVQQLTMHGGENQEHKSVNVGHESVAIATSVTADSHSGLLAELQRKTSEVLSLQRHIHELESHIHVSSSEANQAAFTHAELLRELSAARQGESSAREDERDALSNAESLRQSSASLQGIVTSQRNEILDCHKNIEELQKRLIETTIDHDDNMKLNIESLKDQLKVAERESNEKTSEINDLHIECERLRVLVDVAGNTYGRVVAANEAADARNETSEAARADLLQSLKVAWSDLAAKDNEIEKLRTKADEAKRIADECFEQSQLLQESHEAAVLEAGSRLTEMTNDNVALAEEVAHWRMCEHECRLELEMLNKDIQRERFEHNARIVDLSKKEAAWKGELSATVSSHDEERIRLEHALTISQQETRASEEECAQHVESERLAWRERDQMQLLLIEKGSLIEVQENSLKKMKVSAEDAARVQSSIGQLSETVKAMQHDIDKRDAAIIDLSRRVDADVSYDSASIIQLNDALTELRTSFTLKLDDSYRERDILHRERIESTLKLDSLLDENKGLSCDIARLSATLVDRESEISRLQNIVSDHGRSTVELQSNLDIQVQQANHLTDKLNSLTKLFHLKEEEVKHNSLCMVELEARSETLLTERTQLARDNDKQNEVICQLRRAKADADGGRAKAEAEKDQAVAELILEQKRTVQTARNHESLAINAARESAAAEIEASRHSNAAEMDSILRKNAELVAELDKVGIGIDSQMSFLETVLSELRSSNQKLFDHFSDRDTVNNVLSSAYNSNTNEFSTDLRTTLLHDDVKREVESRRQLEEQLEKVNSELSMRRDSLLSCIKKQEGASSNTLMFTNQSFQEVRSQTQNSQPLRLVDSDCSKHKTTVSPIVAHSGVHITATEPHTSEQRRRDASEVDDLIVKLKRHFSACGVSLPFFKLDHCVYSLHSRKFVLIPVNGRLSMRRRGSKSGVTFVDLADYLHEKAFGDSCTSPKLGVVS